MNSGKRARKLSSLTSHAPYEGTSSPSPFIATTPNTGFEGPYSAYMARRSKQSSLKVFRRTRGLTLEGLSELTGISPSYLSRLEGGARRLNTDLLERLSAVLGCQPGELLNTSLTPRNLRVAHNGSSEVATEPSLRVESSVDSSMPQKDLPVYSIATPLGALPGATGETATLDFVNPADWAFRIPQLLGIPTAFALYVSDEQNAPKYMPGDTLYVHTTRPLSLRCSVVVLTKDDQAIVRQFWGWGPDSLFVSSFMKNEPSALEKQSIPRDNLRAAYKIIGTLEGGYF